MKHLKLVMLILSVMLIFTGCSGEENAGGNNSAAVPQGIKLNSVDYVKFFDESHGLAISEGKSLYKTEDGGQGWIEITPPVSGRISASSIFFINPNNGWLGIGSFDQPTQGSDEAKGEVFFTANGGQSWDKIEVPALKSPQIFFIDQNHGWILDHIEGAMMHENVALLKTADGGRNWETVNRIEPQNEKEGDLPLAGNKSGFTFADENNGFLTGYLPVDDQIYLFQTANSGKTWRDASFAVGEDLKGSQYNSYPPVFFDAQNGILPAGDYQKLVVYKTYDGGQSWKDYTVLNAAIGEGKMVFLNMDNWVAADNNRIYVTEDGGKTWTSITPNIEIKDAAQIDFVSTQCGYLVLNNKLYKTQDGGKTWE